MTVELLNSPLHAAHLAVGAKFAEFGGWNMPIAYKGGTIAEHQECRSGCAIFDVSHLGSVRVKGGEALEKLQRTFTNDLERISPGKAQYSHMLNENGGVVDDVIIWWISESSFPLNPRILTAMAIPLIFSLIDPFVAFLIDDDFGVFWWL